MSVERELERCIQGLEWQQFERMLYDLVEADHRDAVRPAAPDSGADVLVWKMPETDGTTRSEVFQAKHYPDQINWDECEESLKTALTYKPDRITFAFSRGLSARPTKTFKTRLIDPYPEVDVHYWDLSKLRTLLQRHTAIRVRYCGHDQQTMLDVLVAEKAPDLFTRILNATTRDDDPAFRYTAIVGDNATLTPSGAPHAQMEFVEGERRLRVLAERKDTTEGISARWRFSPDEAGEKARLETMIAVGRGDREVSIDQGIVVQWVDAPEVVREALEHGQYEEQTARLVFEPGESVAITVTIHGPLNAEREFEVRPFPADEGFDAALVGRDGALLPFFGFVDDGKRRNFAYQPLVALTDDARTNADSMHFQRAFFSAENIEFRGLPFGDKSATLDPSKNPANADIIELTEAWLAVFEAVAFLEDQTGRQIPVHEPPFTEQEIDDLFGTAQMVELREGTGTFDGLSLMAYPAQIQGLFARFNARPEMVRPVRRSVLGTELDLGRMLFRLPEVRVVAVDSIVDVPGPSVKITVHPVDRGDVRFRLLGRDEEPPADAINYDPPPPRTKSGIWLPPGA